MTNAGDPGKTVQPARRSFWKVFAILFAFFLLVIAVVAGALGYSLHDQLRRTLRDEITRNLTQKAQMLANRINADHAHGIDVITSQEGQAAGARATVIDTNGKAIADSEVPVASLEDQGRLPEFAAALRGSTGVDVRTRNGAEVLFVAVPVSGGAVRLAYPLSDIDVATRGATLSLRIGCIVAVLAGAVLAAALARTFAN